MNETYDVFTPESETAEAKRNFATVGAVYADGVSLIFDGEETATEKHYLCNTNVFFAAGDRVRILADSGTYIVEYVVGPPRQEKVVGIPAGGDTGTVLTKATGDDHDVEWTEPSYVPTSGTTGHVLAKTSTGVAWQALRAPELINPGATTSALDSYDIQIRSTSGYTSATPVFEIRMKGSATWHKITTT